MGWFRRRRRGAEENSAPDVRSDSGVPDAAASSDPFDGVADEEFGFLSVAEARQVRTLMRTSFAARGLEVTVHSDHVVDAAGRIFGLHNVSAACHNDPRGPRAWPEVVDGHVGGMLTGMSGPDPLDVLPLDELLDLVFVRLYEAASVPRLDTFPHLDVAPGLVQMLALDQPETVHVLGTAQVEKLGGWPKLYERGLANLRREATGPPEQIDAGGGAWFSLLADDSVYTASRTLLLPELLAGQSLDGAGWLLGAPNRHQLIWHVITDATVLGALRGMALLTDAGYHDSVGPLSPHVYWWNGTEYRQLSSPGADGQIEVQVDPEFQQVLERFIGTGAV